MNKNFMTPSFSLRTNIQNITLNNNYDLNNHQINQIISGAVQPYSIK